ncbi:MULTISPECIES: hypothetical protein [unclassified Streptomyces]|uniref:Secreted protein n=2 Tax=Streptomyces TaxID=1883 RepID=A0ABD5E6L7_9ACTN|nr:MULTISPECIES: hypothetical protein [unclassified Streptomyces]MYQ61419.1 hypothetical protein [Streptomyces sp. SID4926]MYX20325.1 hypothetical protein [Streptomyces sp. SID8380]ASY34449.1 hypothetical protein CAC01_18745 [Streptomyces sp. CLI2509]EGJ76784.1 putative secreted protein [Streptomyces sp. Tu6071]MDT0409247.1 hypothetical protein [Streptomyces sp. DSM 41979]
MSALPLALLIVTAAAVVVGLVALRVAQALRRELAALRAELLRGAVPAPHAQVPAARTDADTIRAAVADALAEERERELAEARAFWAAQEVRETGEPGGGLPAGAEDLYAPRPADVAGLDAFAEVHGLGTGFDLAELDELLARSRDEEHEPEPEPEYPEDSAELAAARRRHPSHPDFVPSQPNPIGDHAATVARLEALAAARTTLADVRPGPLGTLDVYVFVDGTTLCATPGHRETAEFLAEAVREGREPFLLGGSGVSGAFALTFGCGERNVYLLADRVITST